jgi:glyoxylase-like metal-dependent hydrolase (beta-lactamase superfamily II)
VAPAGNITLIRSASDSILIDTGSGANFQPTAGKLSENLDAAGIDAATITKVAFTNAHPDHLWGMIDENDLRFPNASYVVSAAEWNFWTDADLIRKMPEAMHPFVVGAQRNLSRIKDRVTTVKPGADIVTGLRVLDTAGHTPGHISFEFAGGDGLSWSATRCRTRQLHSRIRTGASASTRFPSSRSRTGADCSTVPRPRR